MLESVESCLQLRDADSADVLPHALASNDLSAAHRLFQDAGKLVNLADWYGSYSVALPLEADVAEASAARKSKKRTKGGAPKRKKPAEDELQAKEEQEIQRKARFVRSVSELAWLGLIFPTKRKAEHVGKLVF